MFNFLKRYLLIWWKQFLNLLLLLFRYPYHILRAHIINIIIVSQHTIHELSLLESILQFLSIFDNILKIT